MDTQVHDAAGMQRFAVDLVVRLTPQAGGATVVALEGDLGAGKTTFAQAVAKALGVQGLVNSPTFVIEKIYALSDQRWQRLVHIDAYRLKSADELRVLGWDEIIADKNNLIVIEWPENVPGAIPDDAHRIQIDVGEGEARTIHYVS